MQAQRLHRRQRHCQQVARKNKVVAVMEVAAVAAVAVAVVVVAAVAVVALPQRQQGGSHRTTKALVSPDSREAQRHRPAAACWPAVVGRPRTAGAGVLEQVRLLRVSFEERSGGSAEGRSPFCWCLRSISPWLRRG
jgi:hypothetical protein